MAARVEECVGECGGLVPDGFEVAAGDHLHRAVVAVGVVEGHPAGARLAGRPPPVGVVLMPAGAGQPVRAGLTRAWSWKSIMSSGP